MHILILNWRDPLNPKSGGAEIVTLEHAKAWVNAGHTVTWFTSSFNKAKKNETRDHILFIRRGNVLTVFLYAFLYYRKYKNNLDIIIDEIHGIPFFTPLYVNKPILAFIHEVAGEIWDHMYPFPINKIGKSLEKIFLLPYKTIPFITVSQSTRKELLNNKIRDITVITNGIRLRFTSGQVKKEKDPTFIFVSRIVRMKGIEEVMKAFRIILLEEKNAKLWIIGEGDEQYVSTLKLLAQKLGIEKNIVFYGKIQEEKRNELLARAHLLLHASIKEGWGLVIIEAAGVGTPAVVYNVGGLRDSVLHGQTGIVVRNNTPEELAHEALHLLNDKAYMKFRKNCISRAKSLTWEKTTSQSLELITHTVNAYEKKHK